MSNVEPDEQEEKPLDPAMENVRRKMVKLQLVSAGIMGLLLMAVLVTIGYKLTRPAATATPAVATPGALSIPSDQPLRAVATLPAGFVIETTGLSGAQILFSGRLPDGRRKALIFDVSVGRIVADIDIAGN